MDLHLSSDHRNDEFYAFRYNTRFEKGDVVFIRVGTDLEMARFQARKSFPEVLNEYWWLKPSDVATLRELPMQITDIYYYHGGIPIVVLLSASGMLVRKAQIFLRKKDETSNRIEPEATNLIEQANSTQLATLLTHQNLLIRMQAAAALQTKFSEYIPTAQSDIIAYAILRGNYDELIPMSKDAVDALLERFFTTSNAKEIARIVDTLIAIGEPALGKLDDMVDALSLMASPFYAKRISWTIGQINKALEG